MNVYVEVLLRTVCAALALLVLARINGAKQISQLTFYDYIVGITAGSIAATLCTDVDTDVWVCAIAIVIFMLSSLLFSFLSIKSVVLRRLLMGQSEFLIDRGRILMRGLRRARFSLSDLMRELRAQGYFDVNAIRYAILESNGSVSVMPKAAARPLTAAEQGAAPPEQCVLANVVEDGKVLRANLRAFGLNEAGLKEMLADQGCTDIKSVLLATLNDKRELSVHYVNDEPQSPRTVFQ